MRFRLSRPKIAAFAVVIAFVMGAGAVGAYATECRPTVPSVKETVGKNCPQDAVKRRDLSVLNDRDSKLPKSVLIKNATGTFKCGEIVNRLVELCAYVKTDKKTLISFYRGKTDTFSKKLVEFATKPVKGQWVNGKERSNCEWFAHCYGLEITKSTDDCPLVPPFDPWDPINGINWGELDENRLYYCGSWVPNSQNFGSPLIGNKKSAPMYGSNKTGPVVNGMLSNSATWVTCWVAGGTNPSTINNSNPNQNYNSIWYWTLGDKNSNWGFIPSTFTLKGDQYEIPRNLPNCYSVPGWDLLP